ncbi:probable G-protein coupled receptor 139 [Sinocyclocheilus anshuiensis]|uniref:probable G-protein coupled receptor 139 n=1 Tax=Sinocyclocheilus anshuiensis TaxID=1608454 RepID=UPI0007B89294|nr:PREDICTED: probable G-protein coupled receptor 139 [Sinocyclocheilus anshuiensis]
MPPSPLVTYFPPFCVHFPPPTYTPLSPSLYFSHTHSSSHPCLSSHHIAGFIASHCLCLSAAQSSFDSHTCQPAIPLHVLRSGCGSSPLQSLKEGREAMEHSHIFTVLSTNSSSWSPRGCPLGQFPVIYYSSLLCLGLPANILTVIILSQLVLRRQKSSYNYLLALAVADILVLLMIVFVDFLLEDFILGVPLPHSLNKVVQVLEFSSIHTSIWITVPLTVDRYIAVCHPLRYHTVSYPARTRKVILVVYVGCLITSVPYYWWPELWHGLPGTSASGRSSSAGQHVLVWVHCATVYLLPCSVFFSLNAIIVRKLRCRRSCFRLRGYSTGKTTAILLAITSVFAVLWAPRTLMILYHLYTAQPAMPGPARLLHLVTDVANMLALLNTGVNFFLYCFISKRFRRMAGTVLKALFQCRKQPPFYASHNFSITSSPWISPANSHCIKMLVYQYDKNGKPVCISS